MSYYVNINQPSISCFRYKTQYLCSPVLVLENLLNRSPKGLSWNFIIAWDGMGWQKFSKCTWFSQMAQKGDPTQQEIQSFHFFVQEWVKVEVHQEVVFHAPFQESSRWLNSSYVHPYCVHLILLQNWTLRHKFHSTWERSVSGWKHFFIHHQLFGPAVHFYEDAVESHGFPHKHETIDQSAAAASATQF